VAQVTGKQIFALWLCAIDLFDQKKNLFSINSGDTSFTPDLIMGIGKPARRLSKVSQ
jgi:hypothetical protein